MFLPPWSYGTWLPRKAYMMANLSHWFESSCMRAICLEKEVPTHMWLLTERISKKYQLNIPVGQALHFSIAGHSTDSHIYATALGPSWEQRRTWSRQTLLPQNLLQLAQLLTFSVRRGGTTGPCFAEFARNCGCPCSGCCFHSVSYFRVALGGGGQGGSSRAFTRRKRPRQLSICIGKKGPHNTKPNMNSYNHIATNLI